MVAARIRPGILARAPSQGPTCPLAGRGEHPSNGQVGALPFARPEMMRAVELLPPMWLEARFPAELLALQRDPVARGEGVAHGHDDPVMLVPGYLAGDASLATLTRWLRLIGYRTSKAGVLINIDCSTVAVERLEARLEALAERCGQRAAIVGQSRGGTLAVALARRRPELVSGVVALGSPLTDQLALHPLVELSVGLVGLLGTLGLPGLFSAECLHGRCCAELREEARLRFPPEVGFVSVYSRNDGIVRWRACLHPDAEHVEVDSSHCGMGVHPDVYRVLARSLASFRMREALRQAA
jgi:triacylglycerol lipase